MNVHKKAPGKPVFGNVRFWSESRRFGQIIPEGGGPNVVFHLHNGRHTRFASDGLEFGMDWMQSPNAKDRLVYWPHEGNPTLASYWGYAAQYTAAKTTYDSMFEYRIMEQHAIKNELGGPRPPKAVTGAMKFSKIVGELRQRILKFVPYEPYHNRITTRWFEMRVKGSWVRCDELETRRLLPEEILT